MRFIYTANGMVADEGGGWMPNVGEWLGDKTSDVFLHQVGKIAMTVWEFVTAYLPDLLGYGAVIAGACVIIGSCLGNGGMLKPLTIYGICLTIAFCILGGV